MAIVYLSLGSNLGDRAANLRTATERLASVGVKDGVKRGQTAFFGNLPLLDIERSGLRKRCPSPFSLKVLRASRIYETAPRDLEDQPWFLNQVLECETEVTPARLLESLLEIEGTMGRVRTIPKAARTIDIDILFYGDLIVRQPDLEIPHPRMGERRFVLGPLAELAPELRHPVTGRTVDAMLGAVLDQSVSVY